MLHPKRLESLLSDPKKSKIAKGGVALTLSLLLGSTMIPVCLEGAAFAEESDLAALDAPSYDSETTSAYEVAALGLDAYDDVDTITMLLANHGYTKAEVLSFNIFKLQEVDGALAQSISRLQHKLLAGNQTQPTEPVTPTPDPEEPEPTDPVDPALPTDPDDGDSEDITDPSTGEDTDKDAGLTTDEGDDAFDDQLDADEKENDSLEESIELHPLSPLNPVNGETEYPEWSYEGSREYTHRPIHQSLTTTKFIAVIGEQARQLAADNDLYASVMIAQAILESDSGNSQLAQNPNFNLFGIKGTYQGYSVSMKTLEDDGTGNKSITTADFRKYSSFNDSLKDYVQLLTDEKARFYRGAHKSVADTYAEACDYLQGRYATDTSYAEKLIGIIEAYDLTRYDEPLDYELVDTYLVPLETKDIAINMTVDLASGETVLEERGLADLASEVTSHLGEDYVWGGNTCGSFDCSGLVSYAYKHALNLCIPRTTHYQCLQGEDVDFADLHTGDLVFFANSDGVCVHVGMYLGEGCYIESPQPGEVVKITSLDEKLPTFAKRLCKTKPVDSDQEEPVELVAATMKDAAQTEPQKPQAVQPEKKQPEAKRDGTSIWDVD